MKNPPLKLVRVWSIIRSKISGTRDVYLKAFHIGFLPPFKTFLKHYHEDSIEVFVCLFGLASFYVNDKKQWFYPGKIIVVEPGETHWCRPILGLIYTPIISSPNEEGKEGKTVNV